MAVVKQMLLLLLSLVHLGTATPLIDAVRRGDVATVQALLENGADVNEPNEKGQTSLMLAAVTNSSMGIMKAVLAKNPDIDLQDQYGQTALMWAAQYGSVEKVKAILAQKPQMDLQNKYGWTALMIAAKQGSVEMVKAILAKNPEIDLQDQYGQTALMGAAQYGSVEKVKAILAQKPQMDLQNKYGWTALMIAAKQGSVEMVKAILAKNPQMDLQSKDGSTALMIAARYGSVVMVKAILAKKPQMDLQTENGWTTLIFAARFGSVEMVKAMLAQKPQMDLQNKDGWTALMEAAQYGSVEKVKAMLAQKPQMDLQNKYGWTALMIAAKQGSVEMVKAILAKNPQMDLQSKAGSTALMIAARYGSVEMVKAILAQKPQMDLQNKDGWTALMIAVRQNSPEKVRAILAARPAVDRQANSGATALFLAAEQGCEVCAAELLHLNASVDLPDFAGRTPLICAAERGHLRMVQRLRRHGARTEAVARNGQNALNAARAAQVKYCTEVDGQYADCKYYGLDAERLQATIAYLDDNTPKGFQLFKTMAGNPRLWYLMCPAIAVGTILGVIWHRYINAKDAKKHGSTGARKVALKAVARRQHWHQAFRACEVAACILLPFGMAFLWLDHFTFVPLFFVLYIFPRAIEMGAASIIARPVLLLTGLPRRQGCCDSRTPRLLGTIIFLTVTALMPWECENEISFYVYGDSTAGFLCHGPLATWMVRGIGMIRPALSRSSSQFVCPAYNAMPGWVKTVYFCFQRAIWLTAALWLLLTLLDMLGALSNQGLTAEEEDLADELHNRLLCTATAAEVQQICHGGVRPKPEEGCTCTLFPGGMRDEWCHRKASHDIYIYNYDHFL